MQIQGGVPPGNRGNGITYVTIADWRLPIE